jgi:hypothetical protein
MLTEAGFTSVQGQALAPSQQTAVIASKAS